MHGILQPLRSLGRWGQWRTGFQPNRLRRRRFIGVGGYADRLVIAACLVSGHVYAGRPGMAAGCTGKSPAKSGIGHDSGFPRLECGDELGHHRKEVTDDTVIGHFENWGVSILVDRDDRFCGLHACQVLDRAGDPHGDIQLR